MKFFKTLQVFVNFAKEQMDQQEEVLKDDTKRFRWRHHQDKTLDESDLCLDETEDDDEEFLLQYATFKVSKCLPLWSIIVQKDRK